MEDPDKSLHEHPMAGARPWQDCSSSTRPATAGPPMSESDQTTVTWIEAIDITTGRLGTYPRPELRALSVQIRVHDDQYSYPLGQTYFLEPALARHIAAELLEAAALCEPPTVHPDGALPNPPDRH